MPSIYEMITDRVICQMQKGIIPWEKPWFGMPDGAYNRITRKPYSLLNQLMLELPGEWASFKQWQNCGGKIKKGEKATPVVFWKITPMEKTEEDGTKTQLVIPILRYYNVFHISQVEGVEPKEKLKDEFKNRDPIPAAEELFNSYITRENITVHEVIGNRACYSPGCDEITLPKREQFPDLAEFYSTAFHESVHSTGNQCRLNRLNTKAYFGNEEYSKEELVAEIGAAAILAQLGIENPKTQKNNTAYLQNWMSVLKDDVRLLVSAAGKAEKAVDFINNGKEAEIG